MAETEEECDSYSAVTLEAHVFEDCKTPARTALDLRGWWIRGGGGEREFIRNDTTAAILQNGCMSCEERIHAGTILRGVQGVARLQARQCYSQNIVNQLDPGGISHLVT